MGIYAALFWNSEFTRFRIAKTKRLRRLFSICPVYHPPERHIPSAWAQYSKTLVLRRKITQNI